MYYYYYSFVAVEFTKEITIINFLIFVVVIYEYIFIYYNVIKDRFLQHEIDVLKKL